MGEDNEWLVEHSTPEERAAWVRQDRLTYGGLIAIGTVILQAFLTASSMGVAAMIAVIAWAVALPHLAVLVLIEDWPSPKGYPVLGVLASMAKSLGLGGACVGVGAAFWHISWIAGVVILVSGLGAFSTLSSYQSRIMLHFDPETGDFRKPEAGPAES
ncbi:hypothetical protein [Nocardia sp. CDC160]|uniref:hypothetical protein n=1 Tax=Nocardia sp. CDC160 TaxID=3112166 RepID=UPI002DBE3A47|nr:hypothetical protein [Nocardia sp. CDC160]MEC3913464.1 hypothetical protein [Nocardia sp. CDC160]